jgi:hypothetical protein
MPSTYSNNLKIELIATGEQDGVWGNTTNTNLGTALEQAIVGRAVVTFPSDADYTLTLTTSNAAQDARAVYLVVQGTISASRNLVVPTIFKNYVVKNATTGSQDIVVKTSAGTGVTIPNGKTAVVYVDGTNVIKEFDYVDGLALNSPAMTGTPTAPTAAPGTNTTQVASTAFVGAADTAAITAERTASATLTNKTISVDDNTVSGIAASSFVLSNASGNIDGSASQKAIPAGVVVGDTDTQTLTNKTISGAGNTINNINGANISTGNIAAARIVDALNAGGSAPIYACRAWVNFNGTGTVAVRSSGNVSSITDNGTGLYTVNFTTAMSDANYAWAGSGRPGSGGVMISNNVSVIPATGSLAVTSQRSDNQPTDIDYGTVTVFR